MEKSAEAFRTISEVAEILQTPAHVLRFWESRFPQIKPIKRAGGRRYYRPSDVALLSGIRRLLHDDGLTIRGVQKILREQGIRKVAEMAPADEAGFVELEIEDEAHVAEIHPFPQRTTVAHDEAGWTFVPTDPQEDQSNDAFFENTVAHECESDEPSPAPMVPADAAAARQRAERMTRQHAMPEQPYDLPSGHLDSAEVESDSLAMRIRRLDDGALSGAEIRLIADRLVVLRQRMLASLQ